MVVKLTEQDETVMLGRSCYGMVVEFERIGSGCERR